MDRKEYDKQYYQKNKEKKLKQVKDYYENNKDYLNDKKKEYYRTPVGKKVRIMSGWKTQGVINVNDDMYENYINTTCCDCCKTEFKDSFDRCLDHNHTTGEFRQVLCRNCNNMDKWENREYRE